MFCIPAIDVINAAVFTCFPCQFRTSRTRCGWTTRYPAASRRLKPEENLLPTVGLALSVAGASAQTFCKEMRRVTACEIEEMRARGCDAATLREALQALERNDVAERIIERVAEAFAGVTLGDGVGLHQAQALDQYEDKATCAIYRETDEKEDWQRIPSAELNLYNSSWCYFDPEGMRFHLPAYMTAELRGEYNFGMAWLSDYEDMYSALDPNQRQAVRQFLLFLLGDPEYEFDRPEIERALAHYWTEPSKPKTSNAEQDGAQNL